MYIRMTSRMYHQNKQKTKNQEPLAVARLLFLTSNLQIPPTVYSSIEFPFKLTDR